MFGLIKDAMYPVRKNNDEGLGFGAVEGEYQGVVGHENPLKPKCKIVCLVNLVVDVLYGRS
jgi:hypothetical protein